MTALLPGLAPTSTAVLSADGVYRYRLTRRWAEGPTACWIMLNPSTADAEVDDRTIRKCIGFSRRWGFAALQVLNLFALRSTDPDALLARPDPVGPDNDWYLAFAAAQVDIVVCAWGAHKAARKRGPAVLQALRSGHKIKALGFNADGSLGHPLYLPNHRKLVEVPDV
jgi:hypothetical protein